MLTHLGQSLEALSCKNYLFVSTKLFFLCLFLEKGIRSSRKKSSQANPIQFQASLISFFFSSFFYLWWPSCTPEREKSFRKHYFQSNPTRKLLKLIFLQCFSSLPSFSCLEIAKPTFYLIDFLLSLYRPPCHSTWLESQSWRSQDRGEMNEGRERELPNNQFPNGC